jgi:hypothetical protein
MLDLLAMTRPRKNLLWLALALALSVALHLAPLLLSHDDGRTWMPSPRRYQDVRIVLNKPPAPVAPVMHHGAVRARRSSQPRKARTGAAAKVQPQTKKPRTAYEGFLPGPDHRFATDTDGEAGIQAPFNAAAEPAVQEFGSKIDIPLFFRQNSRSAKAFAKILRRADQSLLLEFVDGEPLLRAVLFEALLEPEAVAAIYDLMAQLPRGDELLISLRQKTVAARGAGDRHESNVTLNGKKLVIEKILYQTGAAPISLPDKEAERAKARDKGHLDRLTQSRAFFSPIRNHLLATAKPG